MQNTEMINNRVRQKTGLDLFYKTIKLFLQKACSCHTKKDWRIVFFLKIVCSVKNDRNRVFFYFNPKFNINMIFMNGIDITINSLNNYLSKSWSLGRNHLHLSTIEDSQWTSSWRPPNSHWRPIFLLETPRFSVEVLIVFHD